MTSPEHDVPDMMFRDRPRLGPYLAEKIAGLTLPNWVEVRRVSADFTYSLPGTDESASRHCDAATVLLDHDQFGGLRPTLGMVLVVQRAASDIDTETTIRRAAANAILLRGQQECPAQLVVFCPDESTVAIAGKPIPLDFNGSVVNPVVISLNQIPKITDPDEVEDLPELAVLSAAAHGSDPECGQAVLEAAFTVIARLPAQLADRYTNYVRWYQPSLQS